MAALARGTASGPGRKAYILVHQACFSNTTITEDNHLSCGQHGTDLEDGPERSCCGDGTLRRTFFLDAIVAVCLNGSEKEERNHQE